MLPAVAIIVAAAVVVATWPRVLDFLRRAFLPWVRNVLPPAISEALTGLVVFLDQGICSARRTVAMAWQQFKTVVLGMDTVYTRLSHDAVEAVETSVIDIGNGKALRRSATQRMLWQDVPTPVREAMVINDSAAVRVDNLQVIESRMSQKARDVGGFEELIDFA